ncbi:MAG: DUF302 domain-containing protein [Bacteroidales bacterium]|nr:DUF302 domain-containing protein [Bacteroidales bacterium]
MSYYFSKVLKGKDLEQVTNYVIDKMKLEGFGVLTQIDMKATLKNKIGADIKPYIILGACHPQFAYEALTQENKIGTMLPCNFIIQELESGEIEVAAVDPIASMISVENSKLGEVAQAVHEKIKIIIDSL